MNLSRERIIGALEEMSNRLRTMGIRGEVCLLGGTAMVLGFKARQSTKDIDAVFAPVSEIRKVAEQIGIEKGYDKGWFNDGVKGFLSTRHETTAAGLPQFANLNVTMPVPEYLFAMKCMSARIGPGEHDDADARTVAGHLGLKNAAEALKVVEQYYAAGRIPPRTQYFVESLFEKDGSKN